MELANRAYVETPQLAAWAACLLGLAVADGGLVVICVPLLSAASPLLRAIGWSSTVLFAAVTAYRFALVRPMVLFYDKDGIGKISEALPWRHGMRSVKWRDIEHVEFENRLSAGLMRSYPVRLVERYTEKDKMRLPRRWRGNQAA